MSLYFEWLQINVFWSVDGNKTLLIKVAGSVCKIRQCGHWSIECMGAVSLSGFNIALQIMLHSYKEQKLTAYAEVFSKVLLLITMAQWLNKTTIASEDQLWQMCHGVFRIQSMCPSKLIGGCGPQSNKLPNIIECWTTRSNFV